MSSIKAKDDIIAPIVKWLQAVVPGHTVIVNRPNWPRPEKGPNSDGSTKNDPYLTVSILNPARKKGSRDSTLLKSGTKRNVGGQRTFTLEVQAFGGVHERFFEAQDLLTVIQDSVEDSNKRSILRKAGIAIWSTGDILDISETLETGYESRASLEIVMGIASNREVDYGQIDKVEVIPTVDGVTDPVFTVPAEEP